MLRLSPARNIRNSLIIWYIGKNHLGLLCAQQHRIGTGITGVGTEHAVPAYHPTIANSRHPRTPWFKDSVGGIDFSGSRLRVEQVVDIHHVEAGDLDVEIQIELHQFPVLDG